MRTELVRSTPIGSGQKERGLRSLLLSPLGHTSQVRSSLSPESSYWQTLYSSQFTESSGVGSDPQAGNGSGGCGPPVKT